MRWKNNKITQTNRSVYLSSKEWKKIQTTPTIWLVKIKVLDIFGRQSSWQQNIIQQNQKLSHELHKKCLLLKILLVNVTTCHGHVHIYERNPMESFIFCAVYNCPYISDASPVSLKNTDQKIIGTLLCTCVALFEDSQSANIPYITTIVLIRKSFWLWNLKKMLDLLLWEILVNPLSASFALI